MEKPKTVDLDKVLQGLKCCDVDEPNCVYCPYAGDKFHCYSYLRRDAITLIEQLRHSHGTAESMGVTYVGKA